MEELSYGESQTYPATTQHPNHVPLIWRELSWNELKILWLLVLGKLKAMTPKARKVRKGEKPRVLAKSISDWATFVWLGKQEPYPNQNASHLRLCDLVYIARRFATIHGKLDAWEDSAISPLSAPHRAAAKWMRNRYWRSVQVHAYKALRYYVLDLDHMKEYAKYYGLVMPSPAQLAAQLPKDPL